MFFNISKSIHKFNKISLASWSWIVEIQSKRCSLQTHHALVVSANSSANFKAVFASFVNLSNGFIKYFFKLYSLFI